MLTLQQLQESVKIIADPVQNNLHLIEECVELGERVKEAITAQQNFVSPGETNISPETIQTLENCLGFALLYYNGTITILPDTPSYYPVHPEVRREILERLNIVDTTL